MGQNCCGQRARKPTTESPPAAAVTNHQPPNNRQQQQQHQLKVGTSSVPPPVAEKPRPSPVLNGDKSSVNQVSTKVQQLLDAGRKVARGLYDYRPTDFVSADDAENDLPFRKSDSLLVLREDGDWWYAENITSGQRGYVPTTYVAEVNSVRQFGWFHHQISRKEAINLLASGVNQRGTFLVRESETVPGIYSLSVLTTDDDGSSAVKHYRIRQLDDGRGCFIAPAKRFADINSLIQHYSNAADGLCCQLTKPCPKSLPVLYDMSHATRDRWEIDRRSLTIQDLLGEGMYGTVCKGVWNKVIPVAVKTLKPGTMAPSTFMQEASVMKKLQHPRLVALFAVCSREEPLLIITELMSGGSLLSCLQKDQGRTIQWNQLVDIATQVADGMQYLERSMFIHRDLAARNVLVGVGRSVKIGDFGLARTSDCTPDSVGTKFPIKWTAPEAVKHGQFSTKSDVWSYGIFLIELVTYGQIPYYPMTNREVTEALETGYRHPQPANCQPEMYDLMLMCWHKSPAERPTFEFLFHTMDDYNVAVASSYADT